MDAGDGCGGWCLDRCRAASDWIVGGVTTPVVGLCGIDARETRSEMNVPTGRIRFRTWRSGISSFVTGLTKYRESLPIGRSILRPVACLLGTGRDSW